MSVKIFKSVFFTSILVLAVSLLLIFNVLFDYFEMQIFAELESEAAYISYGLENNAENFFENLKNENKRVTIISDKGTVLADTSADAINLENHSDRKEIRDALLYGKGKSARYSDTLLEKTLYYAVKTDDGTILRVSTTQNSAFAVLGGLMQSIVLIIVTAMAISLFLSYKVSDAIIKPINTIDLEHPEDARAYDELAPLLKKLTHHKQTINSQIKQAEKSREEFKLICENMNEGLIVTDKNARVLSHNNAAIQLLGIEAIEENSILAFNRTKNFRETVTKALNGERAESKIKVGDRVYNLIASPVTVDKETIGSVVLFIDITENARREQLRQEFTSNVSHELKTPLTSISGFAEMLKSGDISNETAADFASSIYDEAQRLIALVSDIIKISELDEGTVSLETENVDLYALCKEIAKRLEPVCKINNITISVEGETALVGGARKILDEMIYNLCDNAIKYNVENGYVKITVSNRNDNVCLTVVDGGIGIPQNEQTRVFERFYRVDKSRSKSAGGTGLGLAIVKHGAMYHNAQISLESTEGKGTIVTLVFKLN